MPNTPTTTIKLRKADLNADLFNHALADLMLLLSSFHLLYMHR